MPLSARRDEIKDVSTESINTIDQVHEIQLWFYVS